MRIERGQLVVVYLAAANRDPSVFPDPHRFDIERPNAGRHLAFSGGRHFCLGAALARMEGEVGLRTLFERYPDPRVEDGATRRSTRILRGYEPADVPTEHIPTRRAAAQARFAELLDAASVN